MKPIRHVLPIEKLWDRETGVKMVSLTFTLLCMLLLYPYITQLEYGERILTLFGSFILIAAVFAVSDTRRHVIIGLLLGIPAFVFKWVSTFNPSFTINVLHACFQIAFFLYVCTIFIKRIFSRSKVTANEIFGAVNVYLIMGVAWSLAYTLLSALIPGAFNVTLTAQSAIYYSFVTLTTVGYGDILPLIPQAQSLAILEAMFGVLFLTITIARLVGLYSSEQK